MGNTFRTIGFTVGLFGFAQFILRGACRLSDIHVYEPTQDYIGVLELVVSIVFLHLSYLIIKGQDE